MEHSHLPAALLADCHYLGRMPACDVLVHRNAVLPWFILVPETRLHDFLDLPQEHREAVLGECASVSTFMKQVLGFGKVNFAGLGNVVPEMHLHIIARHPQDPAWPQPVWGNLSVTQAYTPEVLRDWQSALVKLAGLMPAPL